MVRKKIYIYTAWTKPYVTWVCSRYFRTLAAAYAWFRLALLVGHYTSEQIRICQVPFDEYDTANPFGFTKDLTVTFLNHFVHENEFRNSEEDSHRD